MPSDRLRVGLIGANIHAGWGGSVHARAITALPEYELIAVGTAHRETADEAARYFETKYAFDNYTDLIACPDIDVVAVVVRVPYHHEMVVAALKAGKHVFCEWPLGANLQQAEELSALANTQGVRHIVGLQGRAEPTFAQIRRLIGEGYVGDVLTCRVTSISGGARDRELRRSWQTDPALGAHTLTIPAGHLLDSFRFAVGDFREVSALVSTQVPEWRIRETGETIATRSPDNVLVNGVLGNGATVSVQVAAVPYHGGGASLEIYGSEGTLTVSGGQVQIGGATLRGGKSGDAALEPLPIADSEAIPDVLRGTPAANVARLYQRLSAAVRDSQQIEPDFDTALGLHRLLNAIEVSSRDGKTVAVA